MIFRKSLDTSGGVQQDDDRFEDMANITPLFKNGQRSEVENYGPVSMTSDEPDM